MPWAFARAPASGRWPRAPGGAHRQGPSAQEPVPRQRNATGQYQGAGAIAAARSLAHSGLARRDERHLAVALCRSARAHLTPGQALREVLIPLKSGLSRDDEDVLSAVEAASLIN